MMFIRTDWVISKSQGGVVWHERGVAYASQDAANEVLDTLRTNFPDTQFRLMRIDHYQTRTVIEEST